MSQATGVDPTLGQVLWGPDGETALRHDVEAAGAAGAIDHRLEMLPPGLRAAAREEVIRVVAGALDLPLTDVLVAGWRKWEALTTAARHTLDAPGETEIVELLDHDITSSHHPRIDVTLDGQRVAEIEVGIDVTLLLHTVTAVVTAGRLSALRSGRADVDARVAIEGVDVAHASRSVALPIEVGLGAGIPLVTGSDVVVLPPAPTREPTPDRPT